LDWLCTAVAAELVANLIYFSEGIEKESVEKTHTHTQNFEKAAYKGVTRGH
jgi:hypothetical protein